MKNNNVELGNGVIQGSGVWDEQFKRLVNPECLWEREARSTESLGENSGTVRGKKCRLVIGRRLYVCYVVRSLSAIVNIRCL